MKYSLFLLEKFISTEYTSIGIYLSESCFEYVDTYETLEKAQEMQKHFEQKTIILASW
jgi:hypothetical protein